MGLLNSRLLVGCFVLVSIWVFPAVAQTTSNITPSDTTKAVALPGQEFHCHTGYPLAQCQKDLRRLKSILARYPVEALGPWTWVLIRSEDWTPISRMLHLNPDSPAFSALEPRETFLDEALFAHDAERTVELMREWDQSIPRLLEHAVSHELGHAFCAEPNEAAADRFGEQLSKGIVPPCPAAKETRNKRVFAGVHHGLKANVLP